MKLNNRGWGLGVFLLFLLMFLFVLLFIANLVSSVEDRFIVNNNIFYIN